MDALRWLLGIACGIALAAVALIVTVGKGFSSTYRSGAGAGEMIKELAIFGIVALLIAMLVSVFLPNARIYLHVVAGFVAIAMAGCIVIMLDHPGEGALYLLFLSFWLVYYALAVFRQP